MVGPRTCPQTCGEVGRVKEKTLSTVKKEVGEVTYLFVRKERL